MGFVAWVLLVGTEGAGFRIVNEGLGGVRVIEIRSLGDLVGGRVIRVVIVVTVVRVHVDTGGGAGGAAVGLQVFVVFRGLAKSFVALEETAAPIVACLSPPDNDARDHGPNDGAKDNGRQ